MKPITKDEFIKDQDYYGYRFLVNFLDVKRLYNPTNGQKVQSGCRWLTDKEAFIGIINRYMEKVGDVTELQDFLGKYMLNKYAWVSTIGLIDAMDAVIKSAKEEGKINDK